MRGMIFAVSPEGVIGLGGKIPWRHPGDFRRFKRLTTGTTVIMGRATFDEVGKPLPGRRNLVVTSRPLEMPGVETVRSVDEALARAGDEGDVWFIGGARIYDEAMRHVDVIDVTYVPDHVDAPEEAVHAPSIDESVFEAGPMLDHEDEPALKRRVYTRRKR
jgi:dihydrofolate reductase